MPNIAKNQRFVSANEDVSDKKARFTGKGMRSLRKKMRLSLEAFGKLVGVSKVSVYKWGLKNGPLRLRHTTRATILVIRNFGATEAKAKLAEMVPVKKTAKKRTPRHEIH